MTKLKSAFQEPIKTTDPHIGDGGSEGGVIPQPAAPSAGASKLGIKPDQLKSATKTQP